MINPIIPPLLYAPASGVILAQPSDWWFYRKPGGVGWRRRPARHRCNKCFFTFFKFFSL